MVTLGDTQVRRLGADIAAGFDFSRQLPWRLGQRALLDIDGRRLTWTLAGGEHNIQRLAEELLAKLDAAVRLLAVVLNKGGILGQGQMIQVEIAFLNLYRRQNTVEL